MTEVRDAAEVLIRSSHELDDLSKNLMQVEVELAPIERDLEVFVADFQVALYEEHRDKGERLPASEVRIALAHRVRGRQRISDLKGIVDAQRSILSALKIEVEASEGPQPAWTP